MVNIAIFASGSGTNAENICNHLFQNPYIKVSLIVSNRKEAYVLKRAEKLGIKSVIFSKNEFETSDKVVYCLKENNIDFIVLAGFLLKIPTNILEAYPSRIINIHPALLPNYGGKGMYGDNVHKAVKEAGEHESGISIHYVNENYDEGDIIFQAKCQVDVDDTFEDIATKVHALEYAHFPACIEDVINKTFVK